MPKPRREGYLLIDHKFSPGITPEQAAHAAAISGRAVPVVGKDTLWESATVTCLHCNAVVILNPNRTRPRHYCAKCDGYICDGCDALAAQYGCRPFEKLLDYIQAENGKAEDQGEVLTSLPDLSPLYSTVHVFVNPLLQ